MGNVNHTYADGGILTGNSSDGKVLIIPEGRGLAVAELDIKWRRYPKADKAIQARKAATLWANYFYSTATAKVFVDMGSISPADPDGRGTIFLGGTITHHFTVRENMPAPVPAASLFGGGR